MTDDAAPWRDREVLCELYVEGGLTTYEAADELGCSRETVRTWLDRHGIDRRGQGEYASRQPAAYYVTERGYGEWSVSSHTDGNQTVGVHRLAAVAWFGYEAVAGKDVHHRNGIPWDNREDNLEPLSRGDHLKHHIDERYGDSPWRDESTLRELYVERGLSSHEVGEELGCSHRCVLNWLDRHGIGTRQ